LLTGWAACPPWAEPVRRARRGWAAASPGTAELRARGLEPCARREAEPYRRHRRGTRVTGGAGTGTVRAAGCGRHRLDARTFVEGGRAPPSTHVQGHRSPARHDRGIRPYRDLRSGGRGEPHPVGVHGAGL